MSEQAAPQNLEEKLAPQASEGGSARCTWEQLAKRWGVIVEKADGTIEHHGMETTRWKIISGRWPKAILEQLT